MNMSACWQHGRCSTDLCNTYFCLIPGKHTCECGASVILLCNLHLSFLSVNFVPLSCLCFYIWYLTVTVQNLTSHDSPSSNSSTSGTINEKKPEMWQMRRFKTKSCSHTYDGKWHKHAGANTDSESAQSSNRETETDAPANIHTVTQMRTVCCKKKKSFSCSANY